MVMKEFKVDEVLHYIDEAATTSMRDTARLLHQRRKRLVKKRKPGQLRHELLAEAGIPDNHDELVTMNKAYASHLHALSSNSVSEFDERE